MNIQQNSLAPYVILYRYRDTKDAFPIGGLADIGETPIAADSRYYRHLINFVLVPHDRLCLFRVLKGLKDLMPSRISMYILDVKAG